MTVRENESKLINVACYRYKVLAQQYKAMYPTLEIDIEGELVKLKVIKILLKNVSRSIKLSSLQ